MISNFYRMKNNIPLIEEGHEFIESNPPERKNRDYKARPRNYTFGFPIYKKDAYTRHWGNFMIVAKDKEHAGPRYFKIGASFYIFGVLTGGLFKFANNNYNQLHINTYNLHLSNYTLLEPFKALKNVIKDNSKIGLATAAFMLSFFVISDFFKSKDYSTNQSYLRASLAVIPITTLIVNDRPFNRFILVSGLLSITFYLLMSSLHNMKVNNGANILKHNEGDFIYLKNVSENEREMIEYEDQNYLKAKRYRQLNQDQKFSI